MVFLIKVIITRLELVLSFLEVMNKIKQKYKDNAQNTNQHSVNNLQLLNRY